MVTHSVVDLPLPPPILQRVAFNGSPTLQRLTFNGSPTQQGEHVENPEPRRLRRHGRSLIRQLLTPASSTKSLSVRGSQETLSAGQETNATVQLERYRLQHNRNHYSPPASPSRLTPVERRQLSDLRYEASESPILAPLAATNSDIQRRPTHRDHTRSDRHFICSHCQPIYDYLDYYLYVPHGYISELEWGYIQQQQKRCLLCRLFSKAITSNLARTHPPPTAKVTIFNRPSWASHTFALGYDIKNKSDSTNAPHLKAHAEFRGQHLRGQNPSQPGMPSECSQRLIVKCEWRQLQRDGRRELSVRKCVHGELQNILTDTEADWELQHPFGGRKLGEGGPDWRLLKDWIHQCDGHGCNGSSSELRDQNLHWRLRVIDIERNMIRQLDEGEPYVALSYVWGNPENIPTTRRADQNVQENGDVFYPMPPDHQLPATIRDAIESTKCLGYRYLWVDSLCILQDDEDDRHSQIDRMRATYACADLTIAVASGRDALAGISSLRRRRGSGHDQFIDTVGQHSLGVCLPTLEEVEKGGYLPWNRRAWTYQEMILSKRLLIFTDYQVYFRCNRAVWCEDTRLEMPLSPLSRPDRHDNVLRILAKHTPRLSNTTDLGVYLDVIEQYSRREITRPEDKVPAVQGILQHLDRRNVGHSSGIPNRPEYFHMILLWQPRPNERYYMPSTRAELELNRYPSYSWAHWTLPAGCVWFEHYLANAAPSRKRVRFRFEKGTDVLCATVPRSSTSRSQYRESVERLLHPDTARRIVSVGYVLVVDTVEMQLRISRQRWSLRGHPNSLDAFEMEDLDGRVVGEIWTTEENISCRRGAVLVPPLRRRRQDGGATTATLDGRPNDHDRLATYRFVQIGYGSGMQFAQVDRRFLSEPERPREKEEDEEDETSSFWRILCGLWHGNNSGSAKKKQAAAAAARRRSARPAKDRRYWPTVTVMQIDLSDDVRMRGGRRAGVGTRIAVGSVMRAAWDRGRLVDRRLYLI